MVSGVLGKISQTVPHPCTPHVFRYADSRYFCSPLPLFGAPSLGALGSFPSRLPLDLPLVTVYCLVHNFYEAVLSVHILYYTFRCLTGIRSYVSQRRRFFRNTTVGIYDEDDDVLTS